MFYEFLPEKCDFLLGSCNISTPSNEYPEGYRFLLRKEIKSNFGN